MGVSRRHGIRGAFAAPGRREAARAPAAGAGLIFSREQLAARPDLGPARTIVDGVAGPRVRGVWIAGRAVRLSRRRAFVAVFDGTRAPRVRVTYEDGSERTWPGGG